MTSPSTQALPLAIEGLGVQYGGSIHALADVSLEVPQGGFVSVLGANGAGKTSLVRAIMGLLFVHDGRVTRGSISYGGTRLEKASSGDAVRAGIGLVPEGRKLFPHLSVADNLRCGGATRRHDQTFRDQLHHVYELFPILHDRRNQTAGLLSGGEQQMVAVARALMSRPTLLVCDELSLGLAPIIVRDLFAMLRELNDEGLSVLVIEQNASIALQYSKHGYVLDTGRLVAEGSSAELRDDPQVQELYLGGAGDVRAEYAAIVASVRGDGRGEVPA